MTSSLGNKEIMATNIRRHLDKLGMNVKDFATAMNFKYTTVLDWVNAKTYPRIDKIEMMANFFKVEKSDLVEVYAPKTKPAPGSQKPTDELTATIIETVRELSPEGKQSVLGYAREVLEREEDEAALAEQPLFTIYYTSAAKAGPTGFSYDDYDNDKYAYTDEEPPRYDIATMVDGWSMAPDYDHGDILYLRDYGTSHYNGQECVVVVDDKNYFKKVYTTDDGLLLVSINEDKDEFPDFTIPFPPDEDTHIKIFEVVGSFTPVEG